MKKTVIVLCPVCGLIIIISEKHEGRFQSAVTFTCSKCKRKFSNINLYDYKIPDDHVLFGSFNSSYIVALADRFVINNNYYQYDDIESIYFAIKSESVNCVPTRHSTSLSLQLYSCNAKKNIICDVNGFALLQTNRPKKNTDDLLNVFAYISNKIMGRQIATLLKKIKCNERYSFSGLDAYGLFLSKKRWLRKDLVFCITDIESCDISYGDVSIVVNIDGKMKTFCLGSTNNVANYHLINFFATDGKKILAQLKDVPEEDLDAFLEDGYSAYSTDSFFKYLFTLLAKLIQADGVVDPKELRVVDAFIADKLKLEPQHARNAHSIFNKTLLDDTCSFEKAAKQVYRLYRKDPEMVQFMFVLLLEIAMSDGAYHEKEKKLILCAKDIFEINDRTYQYLINQFMPDSEIQKHYAILGCKEADSVEHIKRRYREMVKKFHPDKIASKGLSEEFMDFATIKFREVEEAYRELVKSKGMV